MIANLRKLASLRLTLVGLILLGAGTLVYYKRSAGSALWVELPIALLVLNLVAAVIFNARFRRNPPLLAFHICLLLVVAAISLGRAVRFEGRVEIAEGQTFDPSQLETLQEGALHSLGLYGDRFEQGVITVNYAPGVMRGATRSAVRVRGSRGDMQEHAVGDDAPLIVDGYRFYTTSNKGWAILLGWQGRGGEALRGAVHLPSYPLMVRKQKRRWMMPTGEEAELSLDLPDVSMEESWVLRSKGTNPTLLIDVGEATHRLQPGQTLTLDEGELRFEDLRMWMGYRVTSNPALPWIAASAVAAVAFMAWHLWLSFGRDFEAPPIPHRTIAES